MRFFKSFSENEDEKRLMTLGSDTCTALQVAKGVKFVARNGSPKLRLRKSG
jgi:hypothetical protein